MTRPIPVLVLVAAACLVLGTAGAQAPDLSVSHPSNPFGDATSFGRTIAGLDNVTRDGLGDILVGAKQDPWSPGWGRAYLFDGTTGALIKTYGSPNQQNQGHFGFDVAAVPDVDGDGDDDLLVGAPRESGTVVGSGRAYVFRQPNALPGADLLLELESPLAQTGGEFGVTVAGLPDVNGNGSGDLLIGAPEEDGGAVGAGRAYVFDGDTGALIHTLTSPAPLTEGRFGSGLASIPDVDFDGIDDIAVSEFDFNGANNSKVNVFSGADGDFVTSMTCGCWKGPLALAGIPDWNGNGTGEVVIGSTFSVPRIEFWDGSTGTRFGQIFSPDSSATSFFGVSLANAGDATGDGRDEIVVGAWGEGDLDTNSGRAYVVDGATLTLFNTIEPAADGGYTHFWEQFGWDVAGLPDADGDGRPEYLVGAPGSLVSGNLSGAVTAFFCEQQVPATAGVRLGSPPNPSVLSSVTAPKIGSTWSLAIDHGSWLPGATTDYLLVSNQVVNVPSAKGTLLVGLGPGSVTVTLPVVTSLDLAVPASCALVGTAVSVQMFTTDGSVYSGSNALDLVLGTHAAP